MKLLILISLFISQISFAQVSSGDTISAVDINNKTFTIGDIKTSILPLIKFQELHGNCWIQLNQGADNSNIDISGTDLSSALNSSTIKSSSGRVLRAKGGLANTTVGTTQNQATAVNGLSASSSTSSNYQLEYSSSYKLTGIATNGYAGLNVTGVGSSTYLDRNFSYATSTSLSGDNETRMNNLTVNMFIKVNHSCL
jgi:hypothetical protein